MLTEAERRRMRWTQYWTEALAHRLIRRLLRGDRGPMLQPRWLPRRVVTVVSADIDLAAGAGVLWLVSRPGTAKAEEHIALFERCGADWKTSGGGSCSGSEGVPRRRREPVGGPGQLGMIELSGGAGTLSYAYRLAHGGDSLTIPWLGSTHLRVAAEVDHLLLGPRRIDVPANGELVVVWTSPSTGRGGVRPRVVAMAHDGTELSTIGPRDPMDSYTWTLTQQ